jgi:hypothetical protein
MKILAMAIFPQFRLLTYRYDALNTNTKKSNIHAMGGISESKSAILILIAIQGLYFYK